MEQKRINEAGGKIYQNFPLGVGGKRLDLDPRYNPFKITIPFRVLPGRLSVCRAVGDIEAKFTRFGGNPNVVIAKPEITTLKISREHDFIFMGSDGIYDKMSNEEVIAVIQSSLRSPEVKGFHDLMRVGVENVIKESLLKKSLDNVTGILIAFNNFEHKHNEGTDHPVSARDRITNNSEIHNSTGLRKSQTKIEALKFDDYGLPVELNGKQSMGSGYTSPSNFSPVVGKKVMVEEKRKDLMKNESSNKLNPPSLPRLNLKSPRG
jgi:protein phosphatase 2C family protein 2/3